MTSELYQKLDRSREEIRVLDIQPGSFDDELVCTLSIVSLLHDDPKYDAMSYAWGSTLSSHKICVDGHRIEIMASLESGLRRLRHKYGSLTIWADAICINQLDDEERGQQVQLMRRVYSQPQRVHVWLGEPPTHWLDEIPRDSRAGAAIEDDWRWERYCREWVSDLYEFLGKKSIALEPSNSPDIGEVLGRDDFREAVYVIELLAAGKQLYEMPYFSIHTDGSITIRLEWYKALNQLVWIMTRPWWQRVWVLQEVMLPRNGAIVHFGEQSVPLRRFAMADDDHSAQIQFSRCHGLRFGWFGSRSVEIDARLFGFIIRLDDPTAQPMSEPSPSRRVLEVAQMAGMRKARDPRDHVYGVLGLIEDELRKNFFPDYKRSVRDVYIAATRLIIAEDKDLDYLETRKVSSGPGIHGLPSWVLDWDQPQYSWFNSMSNASNCAQHYELTGMANLFNPTLYVKAVKMGVVIDSTVQYDGSYFEDASLISHISSCQAVLARNGMDPDMDGFWRSLIFNEVRDDSLNKASTPEDLIIMRYWWSVYQHEPFKSPDGTTDFWSLINWHFVSHNLRMFCTAEGDVGGAREAVEAGQECFVLAGCRAPVLLRPLKHDEGKPAQYEFCGLCYLDGYMQGEIAMGPALWQPILLC